MAAQLSKLVRDRLKELNMERYKLVVKVYLGERKDQKVIIMAKGYWDVYVDNYITYTFNGGHYYCTVVVYGFYTD